MDTSWRHGDHCLMKSISWGHSLQCSVRVLRIKFSFKYLDINVNKSSTLGDKQSAKSVDDKYFPHAHENFQEKKIANNETGGSNHLVAACLKDPRASDIEQL